MSLVTGVLKEDAFRASVGGFFVFGVRRGFEPPS